MKNADLVIFGCEARQNLVGETVRSLKSNTEFEFTNVILSWDGEIIPDVLQATEPDYVVRSTAREGYVPSIERAVRLVRSEYFFWLEDDWRFEARVNVADWIRLMSDNQEWTQIRMSSRPLTEAERKDPIAEGMNRSHPPAGYAFSANPNLARTDHIRQALSSAREKDEPGNIEVEISEWVHANEKESVVANPGDTPDVSHRGHLERTDRSFHGFTSPNRKQGTVHSGEIGLHNKALLPFKLLTRFITLSVRQLFDDEIYVICLRILSVDKENF